MYGRSQRLSQLLKSPPLTNNLAKALENDHPLNPLSSLIHEIRLDLVGEGHLFKFSNPLQHGMESVLEKNKAAQLTPGEIGELNTISELDCIFTHINAILSSQYLSM